MKEFLTIKEAAAYLKVSEVTLRLWDRVGKLCPSKTPGGHRRYLKSELDSFLQKPTIGNLYEHLCSAQYMANELGIDAADEIMEIREKIGQLLLKEHEKNFKK